MKVAPVTETIADLQRFKVLQEPLTYDQGPC